VKYLPRPKTLTFAAMVVLLVAGEPTAIEMLGSVAMATDCPVESPETAAVMSVPTCSHPGMLLSKTYSLARFP
jgi:hypothetical protein